MPEGSILLGPLKLRRSPKFALAADLSRVSRFIMVSNYVAFKRDKLLHLFFKIVTHGH